MAKRKKRNYRAEYAKRVKRGAARGLPRSVSRGHAGKDRAGILAAHFLGVKPGTNLRGSLKHAVVKDALTVFHRRLPKLSKADVPQRQPGEEWSPLLRAEMAENYRKRLEKMAKKQGRFDWTHEEEFIRQMTAFGMTANEAYTFWFSP